MEILNKSNFSEKTINKIVRFVRPKNIILPKITVKNSKSWKFYGYYIPGQVKKIVVGVGRCNNFPSFIRRYKNTLKSGYLTDFWFKSKEEALVYLLAHELTHYLQHLEHKYNFSEKQADEYALKKLDQWRKKKKQCKFR